jgi:DNA-binding CsgD family transcriptional regulator
MDVPGEKDGAVMTRESSRGSGKLAQEPGRSGTFILNLHDAVTFERIRVLARAYAERAKLSPRETEVFTLFVSEGKSSKEIAAHLGVAYPTVKLYWTRIYKKLDCNNAVAVLVEFLRESANDFRCELCGGRRACRPMDDTNTSS